MGSSNSFIKPMERVYTEVNSKAFNPTYFWLDRERCQIKPKKEGSLYSSAILNQNRYFKKTRGRTCYKTRNIKDPSIPLKSNINFNDKRLSRFVQHFPSHVHSVTNKYLICVYVFFSIDDCHCPGLLARNYMWSGVPRGRSRTSSQCNRQ